MKSFNETIEQMPNEAKIYFNEVLKRADDDIMGTIKELREEEVLPELRPVRNLALVALTAALNGPESKPDAMADMRERIEQARLKGDRETYEALKAGLAYSEAKPAKEEAQLTTRMEAQLQAHEEASKARYEKALADFKEIKMQEIGRMGMKPDEAEAYYNQTARKGVEAAARAFSGYTPHTPIEE